MAQSVLRTAACPHCHENHPRVDCDRCCRQMCSGCISQDESGLYSNVCGLCKDELDLQARRSEAEYETHLDETERAHYRQLEGEERERDERYAEGDL